MPASPPGLEHLPAPPLVEQRVGYKWSAFRGQVAWEAQAVTLVTRNPRSPRVLSPRYSTGSWVTWVTSPPGCLLRTREQSAHHQNSISKGPPRPPTRPPESQEVALQRKA